MNAAAFLLPVALAAPAPETEAGLVRLAGTAPGSRIAGTARLEETPRGLRVVLTVTGAPDGPHALHVHRFGDCSDRGEAAGPHFNPDGAPHGDATAAPARAHPGDLGTVVARRGVITLDATLPRATLTKGPRAVAGRALVLHERGDDLSQPSGNAGGRIACGVISVTPATPGP